MDIDEDDDIYSPEAPAIEVKQENESSTPTQNIIPKTEELEEGEEEDEGGEIQEDDDDSVCYFGSLLFIRLYLRHVLLLTIAQDIDIIVERKDGSKPDPPPYAEPSHLPLHYPL
jgi:pre-mRNA 3'-end-processing factor FIP1